jgi:serine/threonine-protein kinase
MDDERRERLGTLLEQALSRPAEARQRFLTEACGGDKALEAEVASLAAAADSASGWLERGAGDVPAGTVISRYEVLERVGGGMGEVYRARDRELGRAVALKFLPPALAADRRARERLLTEARAASALDHPNIGSVYEIGDAGRRGLFIALAWYDGETLKQRLEAGPLPVPEAVGIARQLAHALAAAHRAGIVHRDVKPSNVICTPPGPVRLVDFGIAKVAGTDLTVEGTTLGTVAYMSPEQTRGTGVDARTDLWSLGVVLYEMLAGRRPFHGESDATLIHAIRHDEPPPLESLRPETPPALAEVVETCLAKRQDERFASAEELLAALDAAERPGAGGPQVRGAPVRRRRFTGWRVTAAGAVAAAAVAAALYAPERAGGVSPRDLAAERHYLLGRYHWRQRTEVGFDSAFHHFSAAIRRDSTFAPAYSGLADVHVLGVGPRGSEGVRLAVGAARTALRLDSTLAEAHASLGFALMTAERDWAAADGSFQRAIALDPNYATAHQWYAELLAAQGRLDEAVAHVRLAEELDRGSAIIGWNVARTLGFARRHDEELAQLRRLASLHPGDERIVFSLVTALTERKDHAEAAATLERFLAAMPAALHEPGRPEAVRELLHGVRSGDGGALLRYIRGMQPPGTGSDGHQALFAVGERAASGDQEGAMRMIEELHRRGVDLSAPDLAVGSFFDRFRDDERFQRVLRETGLDPAVGLRLRNADPMWTARR